MKTALLTVSSALLALCACGTVNKLQPDGGRDRGTCETGFTTLSVKVVDAQGLPVEGAQVTGTNAGLNLAQSGLTDGSGNTFAVNQDIGQGTVTVKAALGSRVTESKSCTWTCSDQCQCAVQPQALTLTLSP
ncbi:MAG: carboxypeptidase-like regulatory domain-containing protein [Myxococcaceae bacterium]